MQIHNPHKGTKIYHFNKPHLIKTKNTLKAVLIPYEFDNGNRTLSFEDKIVYGNNYFIYEDSIPTNLFGQVFFLPNFYSLVFNSGNISFDKGVQTILFEKKGGKIILKTDSKTLPSILLNGDKLLSNNSQQVSKELESGDLVNINGTKMLFVNNNRGILCEISVKNGSKKVSYPSGCVDFATLGGLPQIKGSLYYVFRNFFAKNKKAKVKLTIDNGLQQLILSECEKEINYIKSRDYLTLRSGALTKNKRKMLLNKDYSCSFILMTQDNEILADVSYPYVNVLKDNSDLKKVFAIDQVNYRQSPLINRATQLTYPPGSSFKIVSTMAFLENSRRKYIGSLIGYFPILGVSDLHNQRLKNGKRIYFHLKNFKNEKISGTTNNLKNAFVHSYNIYFAYIAMHLSKTIMEKSLIFPKDIGYTKLGYASSIDRKEDFPFLKYVDLLHINKGYNLFPIENKTALKLGIRRWKLSNNQGVDKLFAIPSVFQVNAYLPDEIAMAAIGQRIVQLTPLQNAVDASVIANNGKLYNPMLVKELKYENKKYSLKNKSKDLNLKKYTVNRIKYFMKQVPKEGTAVGTFSDFVYSDRVWCKTGTAEHNGGDDHSWLVGFYKDPVSNKIFVFAACFPNSGEGSRIAGQCVKRVLDRLFLVSKNIVWENNPGK